MKWILVILIPLISGCSNTKHWSQVEWDYAPVRVPTAKPYEFERLDSITFLNSPIVWHAKGLDKQQTHQAFFDD